MKKINKIRKTLYIILILLIISLISINGITYAKYAKNSLWNYYLKSKSFYMTSDSLTEENKVNKYNSWNNEDIHFSVKNALNNNLITNYDISYKVTCTIKNNDDLSCNINNTNSNIYTSVLSSYKKCTNNLDEAIYDEEACKNEGYKYDYAVSENDMYFNITGDVDSDEKVEVEIKLESTSPYKKTIKGTYYLTKTNDFYDGIDLSYKNYDSYDRLIITNSTNENKCISIFWSNEDIIIDNSDITNYTVSTEGYINEFKVSINKNSSMSYKIFNNGTNEINKEDFSLKLSNEC